MKVKGGMFTQHINESTDPEGEWELDYSSGLGAIAIKSLGAP